MQYQLTNLRNALHLPTALNSNGLIDLPFWKIQGMEPSSMPQIIYPGYNNDFTNYMRNDLSGTGNLKSTYAGYPSDAHPFLQSAVAAVAAAAAGYSQQLQTGVPAPGIPLNLSNMMGTSRESMGTHAAAAASSHSVLDTASRYQAYQNYSQYYQNGTSNNAYNYPQQSQEQKAYHRHASAFQPTGYSSVLAVSPQQHLTAVPQQKVHQIKPTSARNSKKRSANSFEEKRGDIQLTSGSDDIKKEEFDKLVKARTDKLLFDGPVYSPLTLNEAAASTGSSGSGSVGDSIAVQNAKMMKTIIDMKTRTLLQSPGVITFLNSRQRLIESYKHQTELFSAQHQSHIHNQQQRARLQ